MRACQDHASRHGYACVTSSNNYKRGIAYVRCDRGGEYVNHWGLTPETRVRKNRTRRLVGCKWKARAKRGSDRQWTLTMMHDKHNDHGPSANAASHPSLRQLPPQAMDEARIAFRQGRSPKEVLELLQRMFNPTVTAQDVYNLKAKITRADTPKGTPAKVLTQRTAEDFPTDPALEIDHPNLGNGITHGNQSGHPGYPDPTGQHGHLQRQAEVANMVNASTAPEADISNGAMSTGPVLDGAEANGVVGPTKCSCRCCDH